MRRFVILLQFMTRLYLPFDTKATETDMPKTLPFFALLGGVLGGILFLTLVLLRWTPVTEVLGATLLLTLWVGLTGGLHLDGVADSADGLLSGRDRERTLEIMKDSHIGAFGVLALFLLLGLKAAVIYDLLYKGWWKAIVLAPMVARTMAVYAAASFSYARPSGIGNWFIGRVQPIDLVVNTAITVGSVVLFGGFWALLPLLMTMAALWLLLKHIDQKLGGITGDILGLCIESGELFFMLFAAMLGYVR